MSAPTEYARLHVVLAALEHARAGVAQAGKALDAVHGDLAARAAAEKAEPPRKIKAGEGGNVGAVIDYREEGNRIDLRINDVTVTCTEEQVQRMLNLPLIKQIGATAEERHVETVEPPRKSAARPRDQLEHDELDAQFRELEAQVARRELSRRRVEVRKTCTVDHSIDGMSSERWSIEAILVDGRPATREEWTTAETMIERGEL